MEMEILKLIGYNLCISTPCDYMHVMMKEWDEFAKCNNKTLICESTNHGSTLIFNDCMHLLGLARLFEEH